MFELLSLSSNIDRFSDDLVLSGSDWSQIKTEYSDRIRFSKEFEWKPECKRTLIL